MTPMNSPQQHDLEGSTKIDHTLYSHSDTIVPMPNSLQKLDYISAFSGYEDYISAFSG